MYIISTTTNYTESFVIALSVLLLCALAAFSAYLVLDMHVPDRKRYTPKKCGREQIDNKRPSINRKSN